MYNDFLFLFERVRALAICWLKYLETTYGSKEVKRKKRKMGIAEEREDGRKMGMDERKEDGT